MISQLRLALSLLVPALLGVSIGAVLVRAELPELLLSPPDPLSPLGQTWGMVTSKEKRRVTEKVVVGFLPYWLVNDIRKLPPVTELVYFSLALDNQGEIVTRQNPQEVDLGWHTLRQDSTQDLLAASKSPGT